MLEMVFRREKSENNFLGSWSMASKVVKMFNPLSLPPSSFPHNSPPFKNSWIRSWVYIFYNNQVEEKVKLTPVKQIDPC